MADFVAVIRRAVDGLTNNTPEMRVKVYDKARSAVVRQLESMKPRPPESLFQRQLEKLEQAIAEVEAEHAEALPAEGEAQAAIPAAAPALASVTEPEPQPEPAAEPETDQDEPEREGEAEPASAAPVGALSAAEEFSPPEQAALRSPVQPGEEDHDPWTEPAPVQAASEPSWQPEEAPAAAFEPEFTPEPEQAAPEAFQSEAAYEEPVYEEPAYEEQAGEEPAYEVAPVPVYGEEQAAHEAPAIEPQGQEPYGDEAGHASFETAAAEPAPFEPAPDGFITPEPLAAPEPAYEAAPSEQPDHVVEPATFEPQVDGEPVQPAASNEPDWGWPSHGEIELPAAPVEGKRSSDSIIDDFDAYLEGRIPAQDQVSIAPGATPAEKPEDSAWKDFEALIGYDGGTAGAAAATGAAAGSAAAVTGRKAEAEAAPDEAVETFVEDTEQRVSAEGAYPYRAVPKPRPSVAKIGLAALAVLLLAGGGYALWLNRDALTELFKGPSVPSGTPVVSTGNGASTPDNGAAQSGTPAEKLNEGAAGTKFTQRLMADGREVDEGPAGGAAPSGEGQSVARQNVAPQAQPSAGGQTATQAPVASGEKTYLYEEMLGQTTPTAIEGGVVWDMREEKDERGQSQAVVQGTVSVPGRNLTALVTFKRNTDPSLPASHLVEIVFSVPADFEGGAVESVQRISMKRTEQDRGNVLIAVPARITDDFHMIALNDFPDARATNLELLRSRDWIDIPVTYRNGRRALLTLEKGRTGTDAFNKAVSQWQQQDAAAPKP